MKKYGTYLFFLIVIIFVTVLILLFTRKRFSEIDEINKKLMAIQMESQRDTIKVQEINKQFLSQNLIPSLIEDLCKIAEDSRLKKHEILSPSDKSSMTSQQRKGIKETSQLKGSGVYQLNISIEGDYREVAEYIRELQNINYLKKIREIIMVPEKSYVKVEIDLDFFLSGVADASQ